MVLGFVCLLVCLFACLFVYLFVCLFVSGGSFLLLLLLFSLFCLLVLICFSPARQNPPFMIQVILYGRRTEGEMKMNEPERQS